MVCQEEGVEIARHEWIELAGKYAECVEESYLGDMLCVEVGLEICKEWLEEAD